MVVRTHADRIQYAPCILLFLVLFGRNMPIIVQNIKVITEIYSNMLKWVVF